MEKKTADKAEQKPDVLPDNNEQTIGAGEKDLDELVHMNDSTDVKELAEQDPDEAVHQVFHDQPDPTNEVDVDDLLHRGTSLDDENRSA